MKEFQALIKPHVFIKCSKQEELIELTGNEIIEPAAGGELKALQEDSPNRLYIAGNYEPSGIRFPNGVFISIRSIDEIIVE